VPEWLPYSCQPLDAKHATLIVAFSFYADQIGELCAEIHLTLQQQHQDVRVYHYAAKDVWQAWVPDGRMFSLAQVAVAICLHAKVVRFL
jgi:hypothetical protein